MDASTLYSIYAEQMNNGKLIALGMFLDTFKNHPVLAAFFTLLILGNLKKAVTAFIKYFV